MASSKREKLILIVLAVVVGLYLLGTFVFEPYLDTHDRLALQIQQASQKLDLANKLLGNRARVRQEWQELTLKGLTSNSAQTESQTQHALLNWAQNAHVELESQKMDRPKQSGDFQQIRFDVTCSGTMADITQLFLSIETTTLPLQLNEIHMAARKEGTDSIAVQLTVTALVFAPQPPKAAPKAAPKGEET